MTLRPWMCFAISCGSNDPPRQVTCRGGTMGTSYTVEISGCPATACSQRYAGMITARLERINSLLSHYDFDADVVKLFITVWS